MIIMNTNELSLFELNDLYQAISKETAATRELSKKCAYGGYFTEILPRMEALTLKIQAALDCKIAESLLELVINQKNNQ
jgi:hypothetical protein